MDDRETLPPTQPVGTQKRRAPTVLESDGADSDVPPAKAAKTVTRKAPQSKGRSATKKLFLNSDEGDSAPDADSQGAVDKTQGGRMDSAPNLPTRGSKRRHVIVDDDSDDGVAFKGFGKKRKTR